MSSTFAGIEIGKRSIMAHSAQVNTAGHNISNADRTGYSRQRVNLKAMEPLARPDLERPGTAGQLGQGVTVDSVKRVRDELLDERITQAQSGESYWATRDKYCAMLENIYNEPDEVSVRTNMDKFWDSWQELSMYPDLSATRNAVVVRGEGLCNAIRQQEKALSGIAKLLNGDIEATVKEVNSIAKQIAQVNLEIVRSRAMGDDPNDLLDTRDELTDKLSKLVDITRDQRDDDEFMVHVGGKILVQGSKARGFECVALTDSKGYSEVRWEDTGDKALFRGGVLGALLELRDEDVRSERQELNTMAINFCDLVNDVHKSGVGKNNVGGLDFFVEEPFIANLKGNYDSNGDGVEDRSYIFRINGTNELKGSEQIGIEGVITLSGSKGLVQVPYKKSDRVEDVINRINDSDGEVKAYLDKNQRLALKATTSSNAEDPDFVVRHIEDSGRFLVGYAGVLNASGADGAFDWGNANAVDVLGGGYGVAPETDPAKYIGVNPRILADNDCVAAGLPNVQGFNEAGSNEVAVEIAKLGNSRVMIGKSETLDDYFSNVVTRCGLKGEEAALNLDSHGAIMGDLVSLRDSISGVNIDEELADIIKFQHGYNAAAKFVSVQDQMIDTVINRLGV